MEHFPVLVFVDKKYSSHTKNEQDEDNIFHIKARLSYLFAFSARMNQISVEANEWCFKEIKNTKVGCKRGCEAVRKASSTGLIDSHLHSLPRRRPMSGPRH